MVAVDAAYNASLSKAAAEIPELIDRLMYQHHVLPIVGRFIVLPSLSVAIRGRFQKSLKPAPNRFESLVDYSQ